MWRRTTDFEYVEQTPEGKFITGTLEDVPPKFVEQVCDVCEEPGSDAFGGDDVLAEFWDPESETSKTMHGTCGIDAGLELA